MRYLVLSDAVFFRAFLLGFALGEAIHVAAEPGEGQAHDAEVVEPGDDGGQIRDEVRRPDGVGDGKDHRELWSPADGGAQEVSPDQSKRRSSVFFVTGHTLCLRTADCGSIAGFTESDLRLPNGRWSPHSFPVNRCFGAAFLCGGLLGGTVAGAGCGDGAAPVGPDASAPAPDEGAEAGVSAGREDAGVGVALRWRHRALPASDVLSLRPKVLWPAPTRVAWVEAAAPGASSDLDIRLARADGDGWLVETVTDDRGVQNTHPALVQLDSTLLLLWSGRRSRDEDNDVFLVREVDGILSARVNLTDEAGGERRQDYHPIAERGPDNTVWVAYFSRPIDADQRPTDWPEPRLMQLSESGEVLSRWSVGPSALCVDMAMSVDAQGGVDLVVRCGTPSTLRLEHYRFDGGGPVRLDTPLPEGTHAGAVSLARDASGALHLAFVGATPCGGTQCFALHYGLRVPGQDRYPAAAPIFPAAPTPLQTPAVAVRDDGCVALVVPKNEDGDGHQAHLTWSTPLGFQPLVRVPPSASERLVQNPADLRWGASGALDFAAEEVVIGRTPAVSQVVLVSASATELSCSPPQ